MTAPVVFQYLRVAWLTYPYHCCAFQFPATHHPEEFANHEVSIVHTCEEAKSNSLILTRVSRKELDEFSALKNLVEFIFVQTAYKYMMQSVCIFRFINGH